MLTASRWCSPLHFFKFPDGLRACSTHPVYPRVAGYPTRGRITLVLRVVFATKRLKVQLLTFWAAPWSLTKFLHTAVPRCPSRMMWSRSPHRRSRYLPRATDQSLFSTSFLGPGMRSFPSSTGRASFTPFVAVYRPTRFRLIPLSPRTLTSTWCTFSWRSERC